MHLPVRAWEVRIAVHILGVHGGAADVSGHQLVPELIGIEALSKLRHVLRGVVLDVDLPPRPGIPGGDAGIDPVRLRDAPVRQGSGCGPGRGLAGGLALSCGKARAAHASFIEGYIPDAKETGLAQIDDKSWVYAVTDKNFVIAVFDSPDSAHARGLVDRAMEKIIE